MSVSPDHPSLPPIKQQESFLLALNDFAVKGRIDFRAMTQDLIKYWPRSGCKQLLALGGFPSLVISKNIHVTNYVNLKKTSKLFDYLELFSSESLKD